MVRPCSFNFLDGGATDVHFSVKMKMPRRWGTSRLSLSTVLLPENPFAIMMSYCDFTWCHDIVSYQVYQQLLCQAVCQTVRLWECWVTDRQTAGTDSLTSDNKQFMCGIGYTEAIMMLDDTWIQCLAIQHLCKYSLSEQIFQSPI